MTAKPIVPRRLEWLLVRLIGRWDQADQLSSPLASGNMRNCFGIGAESIIVRSTAGSEHLEKPSNVSTSVCGVSPILESSGKVYSGVDLDPVARLRLGLLEDDHGRA